jgi:SAM-dependent methyltransferase
MLVRRNILGQFASRIDVSDEQGGVIFSLEENSTLVDGIGGVLWDGSVIILNILESLPIRGKKLIEFGCGIGICGIFAAFKGASVTLTDREVDLVTQNIETTTFPKDTNICCQSLTWGQQSELPIQPFDIILVCECACLLKQQDSLVQSISERVGPGTLIFVTFDGKPPPNDVKYEIKFDNLMKSSGFYSQCIDYSRVDWYEDQLSDGREKIFSASVVHLGTEGFPFKNTPPIQTQHLKDSTDHHVTVYYRPTATSTCCRCHCQYLSMINPATCTFHSGYYVCRRHPGETRLSIEGHGDSLGYYGNGQEGKIQINDSRLGPHYFRLACQILGLLWI